MSIVKPAAGALPLPPEKYTAEYMNRLIRQLTTIFGQLRNPGQLRGSGDPTVNARAPSPLNLANIPTSATGLQSGDVWSDSGTLKIVS